MPVKRTPTSKNKGKKAASDYIDFEAKLEGYDSGDEDLAIVGESDGTTLSLPTWQTDSPASSVPHKQLDSENRKRDLQEMESNAKKNKKRRLREEEEDYEKDHEPGEPSAQSASCLSLKEKIKAAKEANQKMDEGHFDERIRCPLCHMICSESTNDNGDTYIWCSNKCALPFKTANQKAQFFGELMVRLRADFVNPNTPPNCNHDETCKLIHLSGEKISNPDLQDTLFFVCPRKVADGQCDFVVDAENEGDAAVYNKLLYMNHHRKINHDAEINRKANAQSFRMGIQNAKKKKNKNKK